jgi:hypothetical protein
MSEVTCILCAIEQGDPRDAERLLPPVYEELLKLAAQKLAREKSGQTFDKERLSQADYGEMRRIIREEEPIRPSTRISTMGQAATPVSARGQSDPKRLSQFFRGELDWIVMKALEKDRNRRYETAATFAADVQRFLRDERVSACPPSSWYRLKKTARRYRWALRTAGTGPGSFLVDRAPFTHS